MTQEWDLKDFRTLLDKFLLMSEQEVLDVFVARGGATHVCKAGNYVYIPGSLPPTERVLLVAHADTVWGSDANNVKPTWHGNIVTGSSWGAKRGLGADDRFGCAMQYLLSWDQRHSVIITTGEERGCVGASAAVREIWKELSQHAFAIEVDRRGDQEIALYSDCYSSAFLGFLGERFPEWDLAMGSYTDITEICPGAGISGANFAAGYLNEHTSSEMGFLDAWLRTYEELGNLLEEEVVRAFRINRVKPTKYFYGYGTVVTPGKDLWAGREWWEGEWEADDPEEETTIEVAKSWKVVDAAESVVGHVDAEEHWYLKECVRFVDTDSFLLQDLEEGGFSYVVETI